MARIVAAALLSGCIYDVPITASGTRNIDARLIGDWSSADGKADLKVRELNATTYLLLLNNDQQLTEVRRRLLACASKRLDGMSHRRCAAGSETTFKK